MSTLAQLVVKLTADTGKFQQDLDRSAGTVGRFASSVKSNVQGLGKAALVGLGAMTGLATGAGLALGKLAMDAAGLETVESAFEGIAESSGSSMNEMLSALERGSSGMIAQRDLMTTYNKAAQLVSTTFANQLPDAMQYLSKVAGATGQDMGYLLDSLVTGVGRLSPMILDNLAIQVSLSEATERASQMFGVEAGELTKAQQQAGMMSVVLEKLQKNTAAMPDVTDSAAASVARMRAKFQNLKDNLGRAFLPVLVTVISFVLRLAEKAGPILVQWVGKLSQVIKRLAPTFEDVVGWLRQMKRGIEDLIARIWPAIEPVASWIQNNIQLKDVLMALGIAIASVVIPAIVGIVAAALPLIATAAALIAAVMLVRQAWETDWGGIRTFVEGAIAGIVEFWNTHGEQIMATAQRIFEAVKGVIAGVMAWVQENWPTIQETIVNVLTAVWNTVGPIISEIVTFAVEMFGKVVAWVQQNWPLIQEAVSDTIGTVQTIIQNVLNAIYDFWTAHGESIVNFVTSYWDMIKSVIEQALNLALGVIETVLLIISGKWSSALTKIKTAAKNIWDTIVSWFQNSAGPALWDVVTGIAGKIPQIILGIGQALYNAGKAIIDQLKAGLAAKLEEVKQWFADRLSDIRNMLPFSEPKIGPASPLYGLSRSGEAFWSNWLAGAQRAMPRVEAALEAMTATVGASVGAMQPAPVATAGAGAGVHIYGNVILQDVPDGKTLLQELQGLTVG